MFIQFHHFHLKLQFLKSRCKPCQLGIGASLMILQLLSCITLILRSELTSFQWNLWSPFQLLFLVDQVAVLFQMLASYLNGAHWFLVSTWDPCPCKFFRIPFASTQYTLYWLFMWILYCLKFPREFHQQTIGHLLSKWSCWLPLRYHHLGPQARLLDHHKLVQVLVRILELILANAKVLVRIMVLLMILISILVLELHVLRGILMLLGLHISIAKAGIDVLIHVYLRLL